MAGRHCQCQWQLMGDPLDPNAHDDRTPASADDAPALVPETAPVDTAAAIGGDAAAARTLVERVARVGGEDCTTSLVLRDPLPARPFFCVRGSDSTTPPLSLHAQKQKQKQNIS